MNSRSPGHIKAFLVLLLILIPFAHNSRAVSDEVVLHDGTTLKGRIIRRTEKSTVIETDYGTFTVPRTIVKNYREDNPAGPAEQNTTGISADGKEQSRNPESIAEKKSEQSSDRKDGDRLYRGKLSLALSYGKNYGKLSGVLPSAAGVMVRYTAESDTVPGSDLLPGWVLRIFPEVSALLEQEIFYGDHAKVYVTTLGIGPEWKYPVPGCRGLHGVVSVVPAMSFLIIRGDNYEAYSRALSLHGHVGGAYSLTACELFFMLRFSYISDVDAPLYLAGLMAGVSRRL